MMLTVPASVRAPRPTVLAANPSDPRASTDYVPSRRIGLPGKFDGNSVSIERVTHTVRRGESLTSIAALYGVSVTDLRRWNHITRPTVKPGTRLRIRSSESPADSAAAVAQPVTAPATAAAAKAEAAASRPETPTMHKVRRGESLTSIASRYQVTVKDLRRWNHLAAKGQPKAGTLLQVSGDALADASVLDAPAKGSDEGSTRGRSVHTVRVRRGETLEIIAKRHGVTVQELRRLNHLSTTRVIVGQRLKLPA
jgi:LysM repeat protein